MTARASDVGVDAGERPAHALGLAGRARRVVHRPARSCGPSGSGVGLAVAAAPRSGGSRARRRPRSSVGAGRRSPRPRPWRIVGEALVADEHLGLAVVDDVGDLRADEVVVDRRDVPAGLEPRPGRARASPSRSAARRRRCRPLAGRARAGRARSGSTGRAARRRSPRVRRDRPPRVGRGPPPRSSRSRAWAGAVTCLVATCRTVFRLSLQPAGRATRRRGTHARSSAAQHRRRDARCRDDVEVVDARGRAGAGQDRGHGRVPLRPVRHERHHPQPARRRCSGTRAPARSSRSARASPTSRWAIT